MPQRLVLPSASALFLFFAYRSWCDSAKGEEDAETKRLGGHGALFSSFAPSFVAEPGDKTQLALIALVAGTGKLWAVFLGGTLALWAVSLMGILLGSTVRRRVPKARMHRAAALLCLVFGLLAFAQVLLNGTYAVIGARSADTPLI